MSSSSTSPTRRRRASRSTCSRRVRSRDRTRASSATAPTTRAGRRRPNSDVVVITSGVPRKPGMSRDDLLNVNYKIMQAVTEQIVKYSPNTIIVPVANPLDAMCQAVYRLSKFPRERVIGMAGVLDSARMRTFIAMELNVSVENVHAFVLGGHGDTMVPLPRYSTVAGIPLTELLSKERIDAISKRTADGGAEITKLVGTSAWYAPGSAAAEMVEAILKDKKKILPCSVFLQGEYGIQRSVRRRAGEARRPRRRADHSDQADAGGGCGAEEVGRGRQGTGGRDQRCEDARLRARGSAKRSCLTPTRAQRTRLKYSRFIRAMLVIEISFGQTASHSPSFEQLPNPSASCRSTIATTRALAFDLPLRQQREVADLGRGEERGRRVLAGGDAGAAADAGRRVHRLLGDVLRDQDRVGVLRAADVDRRVAAGLDDPVERAAIDDEVLEDRERPWRATARASAGRRP